MIEPLPDIDNAHPTQDELVSFADGKLEADSSAQLQRHLDVCDACAEDVAELKSAGVVTGPIVKTRRRSRYGWVPGAIAAVVVAAFVLWRGIHPVQPQAAVSPATPAAAANAPAFALTPEETRTIADAFESGHLSVPADLASMPSSGEARGTNPARAAQLEAHLQAQPLQLAVLLAHLGLADRAALYLDRAAAATASDPTSAPNLKLVEDLRQSLAAARGQTAPHLPGRPTQ